MADHAEDNDGDGNIFVYRGGRAPQHVTHVLIDTSIDEIEDNAFEDCRQLLQVDTHNGLRKIGRRAFYLCHSLPRINLKSVVEIEECAFYSCVNLKDVEFGDRLETIIGYNAFANCSQQHLKLPSVTAIGTATFFGCKRLTDVEFSERLESMGPSAFWGCMRLQRIAIPPKRYLFGYNGEDEGYNQFKYCEQLRTVDLVGGIHETLAGLK